MSDASLIADLEAWSEGARSFHGDRELADRVLLATGWRCGPDPEHLARALWEFGSTPAIIANEPYQPHPVNSIDVAIGQLPFGWRMVSMLQVEENGIWRTVAINRACEQVFSNHLSLPIAICMCAVKAWEQTRS